VKRTISRRNPIARAMRAEPGRFAARKVRSRKGKGSYRRRVKHKEIE